MPPPLLLASASSRRAELLRQICVPFLTAPTGIKEASPDPGVDPELTACSNALSKARSVIGVPPDHLILAADTVVALDGNCFGKPADEDEARAMLHSLSGRSHVVITALCLRRGGQELVEAERTEVTMGGLAGELIESYVASGEPMDKAGAYGIQGRGAVLVESIRGDYSNVVGLPLVRLGRMLQKFGVSITDYW